MANSQILAVLITEGSKIFSQMLRVRSLSAPQATITEAQVIQSLDQGRVQVPEQETIATGCVPCSLGHLGTCTGLLNESVRFARSDGVQSPEVIDRVNMCLDELNAMERVDLRPERINQLADPAERELAEKALSTSRQLRHKLEGLSSISDLEQTAGATQTTRQEIGRDWFQHKLAALSPEDRAEVVAKVKARTEK